MLKRIGIGVGLLAAMAGAGALVVAKATPEPQAVVARSAIPADGKPFGRICKSNEIVDSRPAPAWVGASFENDNCRAPRMPADVNGFTASREEVVASMTAAKRYAAASDGFERCIQNFVEARKTKARSSGLPLSTPLVIIENHRIAVSQRDKKLVEARVRNTINNFNEYGSDCPG
jgi:hypothetical protein